jgi:cholesterol oxidase
MSGLSFSEVMRGHIAFEDRGFELAARQGRRDSTRLTARLNIYISDLEAFISDSGHEAKTTGWIECDALGGRLAIERGVFCPFVSANTPPRMQMLYRLWFQDAVGHPLTLAGFKALPGAATARVWHDTSVLFTRILGDHGEAETDVVASGILRVQPADFLVTLASFRGRAGTRAAQVKAISRYLEFFARQLWPLYAPRFGADRAEQDRPPNAGTGSQKGP